MPQTQMFLRTAQTEQRIEALETQVAWLMKYLKVPPEPQSPDEEWEAAAPLRNLSDAPSPQPEPEPEPPKQSKIAERVAKGKR